MKFKKNGKFFKSLRFRYPGKWLHQDRGKNITQKNGQHYNDTDDQNEEISVPDYTETALITDAFNKMLSRIKTLDESRQEFVSNVSHELKTPMTSMKVLADSLVGQQGVPEELYQEFLSDITEEIDRENKIITDLLSLVKMDKKAADMNISNMNINELLENILKRLRPIADQRRIDLILDSFRPVFPGRNLQPSHRNPYDPHPVLRGPIPHLHCI